MSAKAEGKEFFKRIESPITFRKSLLEASKLTLGVLKHINTVKQLREAKKELVEQINSEIKEIRVVVNKLSEMLPKYSKEEVKKKIHETGHKEPHKFTPIEMEKELFKKDSLKPAHKAPASEVDKVTKALEDVQRKLKSL